jgi:CDGSH-type Zn-finger protein/uncharacterized Fe-S cluster protein YjdI
MSEVREYRGAGLVVRFDGKRCIHAAECVRGLPEVFDPNATPWVRPERAAAERVIEIVARCPSGALAAFREDGTPCEQAPATNQARITADGPLHLTGRIDVCDGGGRLIAHETRMSFCRCGASKNKPYCDNSHGGAGFRDEGVAANPQLADAAGGALRMTIFTDGPAQCDGPLAVVDAFGETVYRGEQTWLCRCGASRNKPFCDGSHKDVGFKG